MKILVICLVLVAAISALPYGEQSGRRDQYDRNNLGYGRDRGTVGRPGGVYGGNTGPGYNQGGGNTGPGYNQGGRPGSIGRPGRNNQDARYGNQGGLGGHNQGRQGGHQGGYQTHGY